MSGKGETPVLFRGSPDLAFPERDLHRRLS